MMFPYLQTAADPSQKPGELLEGSSKRGSAKTGVEKRRVVEPEEGFQTVATRWCPGLKKWMDQWWTDQWVNFT